jgi:hypothetical protein
MALTSVELIAPTPGDPNLYVRVLSRQPTLDDGLNVRFALDGGRRWVWASTDDLQLGSISPSGSVTVDGGMYAREGITGPAAQGVELAEGAILATETGNATAAVLGLEDVSVFTSDAGAGSNVDELQRSSLSPGSLMASAAILEDAACPGTEAVNYVGTKWADSRAENFSSHLCLRGGERLALSSWTEEQNDRVTIPENIQAYAIVTDSPSPGLMQVYSTTKTIDLSATSPLACTPRPSCADVIMTAGNHPGAISFWTSGSSQLLGTFRVPVSGVVFADADVFLGVCSSERKEYVLGEVCAVSSGDEPGMTISTPLTIVAGSLRSPQNIVVNSSIHPREDGQLGAVASAKAILPYWMSGQRSQAVVGAHLLAAGSGVTGDSFSTFPSTPLVADRFSSLVVNGSVTGSGMKLGNSLASAMTYKTAADAKTTPPWFGGSDATWRRRETLRFAGVDACDARKCTDWNTDKVQAITPGDPEPPSDSVNPDEPTGVVATPSWATKAQALVSFNSPVAAGSSPIDAYRVTCVSSSGGARRTATGSAAPVTVSNLDPRRVYSCFVEAHSAAGYSEPSPASASFEAWGPADAPLNVSVAHSWNISTRQNEALVSFSTPASDGGLAISGYTATCLSSDGGVTRTASGASSPIMVDQLTKSKLYTCRVFATNIAGNSPDSASSDSFTPLGPPDAPPFGTIVPLVRSASISWVPPADGGSTITGYALRWSSDAGTTWSATYPLPMTSPHVVQNLEPGSTYVFSINATNAIDTSDWSSPSASVKVFRAPDAPTLASVTGGNALLSVVFTAPEYDGGTPITGYEYSLDNGSWVAFPNSTLTQNIVGLNAGQTYSVRIRAVNAAGGGAASNAVSATAYTVPSAPTITGITGVDKQLTVSFSAPSTNGGSGVSSYQYSLDSGAWANFSGTASPQVITGLNIQSYSVRIRAVNIVGGGAASNAFNGNANGAPPAPGGLSVDLATSSSQRLNWTFTNPGDLSKFQVYASNGTLLKDNLATTDRSWSRTGLSQNSSYTYFIRAVDTAGNYTDSAQFSGTTTNATPAAPSVSWENGGKIGTGSGTYQHRLCWSGDNEVMLYQVRIDGSNWQDIWRPAGGWAATVCSSYAAWAAGTYHTMYTTAWDDYWAGADSTTKGVTEGYWGNEVWGWSESAWGPSSTITINSCSSSDNNTYDKNYYKVTSLKWTATIARGGSPWYDLTSPTRRMERLWNGGSPEWAPRGTAAATHTIDPSDAFGTGTGNYGSRRMASSGSYTCQWNATYSTRFVADVTSGRQRTWVKTANAYDVAPVYA